ncbi:MAG: hypothetical protein JSW64_15755 [Candidatus Zixiibacteriota bacterium]|nr:MAG: hypothetical protein JSW64_15755 [candidate division Zixibacteria bacterium]
MSREFLPGGHEDAIIIEMSPEKDNKTEYSDNFPLATIIPRWIFALTEMGIASYFVFKFGFRSGLIFLVYGFVSVFVILPLTRCNRCFYYGKVCNFGLGKWASMFFPRSDDTVYSSAYGYTILLWPLRIIPLGLGLIPILGVIRFGLSVPSGEIGDMAGAVVSNLQLIPHGLFVIYLLVIFLHRKYYRSRSCSRCYHRSDCPVYDKNSILGTGD